MFLMEKGYTRSTLEEAAIAIKATLGAWFSVVHKKVAIDYSECDLETGRISFLDKLSMRTNVLSYRK